MKTMAVAVGMAVAVCAMRPVTAQRGRQAAIPNLAGKILTVRGPIDPASNGPTLMHEHTFIEFKAPATAAGASLDLLRAEVAGQSAAPAQGQAAPSEGARGQQGQGQAQTGRGQGRQGGGGLGRGMPPGWNLLNNFDESLAEVMEFKKAGGGTIVDVTNFGLTRKPEWLVRISEQSGLNVVMGAGWYQKALHPPDMDQRTVEELTDIIVHDITLGAQGTNIRSGIIGEIGVQGRPITENEIKSIRASARASRLTGAPMTFHMGGGTPEEKQRTMDIVAEEGVDLNHVVMGHNGSGDVAVMKAITDRGAYIEFDALGFGPQSITPEATDRLAQNIVNLINGGLTDRILVAHDVCTQPQLKKNGGGGFAYISTMVVLALKAKGVSDQTIQRILVENPRRALTFVAPQPSLAR